MFWGVGFGALPGIRGVDGQGCGTDLSLGSPGRGPTQSGLLDEPEAAEATGPALEPQTDSLSVRADEPDHLRPARRRLPMCNDPRLSAQVRPLKYRPKRGYHAESLVGAPVVLRPDPVTDDPGGMLLGFEAMSKHALLLQDTDQRFASPFCCCQCSAMNSCCKT